MSVSLFAPYVKGFKRPILHDMIEDHNYVHRRMFFPDKSPVSGQILKYKKDTLNYIQHYEKHRVVMYKNFIAIGFANR